MIETY